MVVALIAGAVIGGWAGAYMHGSGMFYSDLFVGAMLLVSSSPSPVWARPWQPTPSGANWPAP